MTANALRGLFLGVGVPTLLFAVVHTEAFAWDESGHHIVAAIAYARLTPEVRKQVDELLAEDQDRLTQPDFVNRSTWADKWRDSDRNSKAKMRFNSSRYWHFAYIDIVSGTLQGACYGFPKLPSGVLPSEGPAKDCVVAKIEQFAAALADPAIPRVEKILALKFLINLVADMHQPLHVAYRREGGGAGIQLRFPIPEPGTAGVLNLQNYWDVTLVDRAAGRGELSRRVARVMDGVTDQQIAEWLRSGPRDWAIEANEVARDIAFNFDDLPLITGRGIETIYMFPRYDRRAVPAVRGQLAKAGVRLASTLNSALEPTSERLVFRLATDILPAGDVQLSNGIVVNRGDWPTLIMAKIRRPQGKTGSCTATLVGPNVAMMAAHCMDDPLSNRVRSSGLEVDGRTLALTCELHPHYVRRDPKFTTPRGSEDYALCLLEGADRAASLAALQFDVVETQAPLRAGEPVLLTGYGCSELKFENGILDWSAADDSLRVGNGQIAAAASGAGPAPTYVTVRSQQGVEPALCPGDSGGPLYSGITASKAAGARRVRGVNSMVQVVRRAEGGFDFVSSMAETGTLTFRAWAVEWLKRNAEAQICGLNLLAGQTPCRD